MGGAPGIFSALWSGRHGADAENLELLLAQMADIPDAHRGAAFLCAAVLVTPGGTELVEIGTMRGRLARAASGKNGFGYDPIFIADGQTVSNAELSPEAKNAISHRAVAFQALAPKLAATLKN
jgi:XTP/dITP diphosphohydrolase